MSVHGCGRLTDIFIKFFNQIFPITIKVAFFYFNLFFLFFFLFFSFFSIFLFIFYLSHLGPIISYRIPSFAKHVNSGHITCTIWCGSNMNNKQNRTIEKKKRNPNQNQNQHQRKLQIESITSFQKSMSNCNGLSVTEYVKQNQQKQENTNQNK